MKKTMLFLLTAVILCSLFALFASAEGADESIVDVDLDWHPANAVANLKYMGLGMLGIFVVVGVVMGITYALNAITGKKK
ncbi:MAG: hypothetical protein J6R45_05350 [Clostridia bacterium]|nr:hypothetical protein [Clostridia bacterium]MBO5786730.1 hypothetical protein [Clostridia bacterium]